MTPTSASPRYVIVTPVRDEADHLPRTIDSVCRQAVPPVRWVIVNDGSQDGSGTIADNAAKRYFWITVVHRKDRGRRLPGGGVMEAFHAGLAEVADWWDYLVKLDADLSFGDDYFSSLFNKFEASAELGIAGGTVCQLEGGRTIVDSPGDPQFHVRGATKVYRRACWDAIQPLAAGPGWDTIDEVKANAAGWSTRTFPDVLLVQHKPTGGADGQWRNAFKNGRANYLSGYHPLFMVAKCCKRSLHKPIVIGGTALLLGFLSGYVQRMPRMLDAQSMRYLRGQQMRRLFLKPSIYG